MELLMETVHAFYTKLIGSYFDAWSLFAKILLTGPALPHGQDEMTMQRAIPLHLQAEYSLLQLQAEGSLAEARTQYRELAKRYHPDAGGHHADFLALQQAYGQVVEYLQTCR